VENDGPAIGGRGRQLVKQRVPHKHRLDGMVAKKISPRTAKCTRRDRRTGEFF